jgi:hypothetical protein
LQQSVPTAPFVKEVWMVEPFVEVQIESVLKQVRVGPELQCALLLAQPIGPVHFERLALLASLAPPVCLAVASQVSQWFLLAVLPTGVSHDPQEPYPYPPYTILHIVHSI